MYSTYTASCTCIHMHTVLDINDTRLHRCMYLLSESLRIKDGVHVAL